MSGEDKLDDLWKSIKGSDFGTGLEYEFVSFKTEVLTTLKITNDGVKASNARMNLIIGALGLVIAMGILLCAIFTLALTHAGEHSMLMTNDPSFSISSLRENQ